MSQLRQPGDYLKHNRTGASPPHVHTCTAESNQKVEKKFFQKEDSCSQTERENSLRQQARESRTRHRKGVVHSPQEREQTCKITLRKGCQQRTTQALTHQRT